MSRNMEMHHPANIAGFSWHWLSSAFDLFGDYLAIRRQARQQRRIHAVLAKWPDWQLDDIGVSRAELERAFAAGPGVEHVALARYLSIRLG